jgi:hypothetical protein
MEELVGRITAAVGIKEEAARASVRIIFSFLYEEGDRAKVVALAERIPGAAAYIEGGDPNAAETLGGLGGLMSGGAMAVVGKLQALGLGMGEIQGVVQQTMDFAREKGGPDLLNDIVRSIPGLSQFV